MKDKVFGGWSIEKECFDKICEILDDNSIIVEFGSGRVSEELSKKFNVYSVEHNKEWVNKYKTKYIYAPLVKQQDLEYPWYDINILKNSLPINIDLILIDGPPAGKSSPTSRWGFIKNIDIFGDLKKTILVFDDIQREDDMNHMIAVAEKLDRKFEIFKKDKMFGIIY